MPLIWVTRMFRRKTPLISFIGMDGSGKTTQTKLLAQTLNNLSIPAELIYTGRGRDNILPIQFFGRLYRKQQEKKRLSKPKRQNKAGIKKRILFSLASFFFALDLLARYWIVIRPRQTKKRVIITDRFSSDILLMAHVPMIIKKALYFIMPKANLIIYLYNDPKILKKRKSEHPIEDLYRQQRLFSQINKKIKPIQIKTANIKQTRKAINQAVLRYL